MKTKTIYKAGKILLAVLLIAFSGREAISQENKGEAIVIRLKPGNHSGGPRVPSNVRITAEYDDVANIVYASLLNAGASVDITIENQSTGETSSNIVSGNGTAMIPFSGTSGNWVITFVLLNGDEYEGEFVL